MKEFVTVFTPLYNRKDLLMRLYESLTRQTDFSFEWVICDDHSTDGSYELAKELQLRETGFPIRVDRAPRNGGKHRAVNRGAAMAEGFLFFIVDSDDALMPNAIERILTWEKTIRQDHTFAGLGFLKGDLSGTMVGTTFDREFCDCTSLEREKNNISGDKSEVFYTEVIRSHPFPEFEGENFLTEAVVWDRIAKDGLKLRWINEVIYLCEYQSGGLTANWERLLAANPEGYALWIRQKMYFIPRTDFERFCMVYGYYYTLNLSGECSMRYACEMLGYPLYKAYFYTPIRKAKRLGNRLREYFSANQHK